MRRRRYRVADGRGTWWAGCAMVASAVAACGGGELVPPIAEPQAPAAEVRFVEVRRAITLDEPRPPLGGRLRLAGHPQGDVYVLDTDHHRILRYSEDGRLIGQAGGTGTGTLEFNQPVDIDSDGLTLWVLDRQNRRLVRLSRELSFIEEISLEPVEDDLSQPLWYDALSCASNGDIFLLDTREPSAARISPSGDVLATYGGFGMGAGRLGSPTDLAAHPDGSLYVTDNRTLRFFDRAGNLQQNYKYSEPLVGIDSDGTRVWAITRSGAVVMLAGHTLSRVVMDPEFGPLQPVDLAAGRAGEPAILDAGQKVWLLSPGD